MQGPCESFSLKAGPRPCAHLEVMLLEIYQQNMFALPKPDPGTPVTLVAPFPYQHGAAPA